MIKKYNKYILNENSKLSGKHSFSMFLQVISNHNHHFINNDHYKSLYNYHLFFSTETITDKDEFIDVFKYKQSLASTYDTLQKIKTNKIAFFFGIKDKSILRYGVVDLDTQRSYVTGEFTITAGYFKNIVKHKAVSYINKTIQNINVKKIPTLAIIKKDIEKFYKDKKGNKVRIVDNNVIKYIERSNFSDEDFAMNRPYRDLDKWVDTQSWKDSVEFNIDDTKDPIEIIIIVK